MEVKAVAKNIRISARKLRPLVNMVRGRRVGEALVMLEFAPSPKARVLAKVVKSAAANAENNYQLSPDLKIVRAYVGEAPTMKRHRPRARGRVGAILKRASHITVVVAEEEGQVGA